MANTLRFGRLIAAFSLLLVAGCATKVPPKPVAPPPVEAPAAVPEAPVSKPVEAAPKPVEAPKHRIALLAPMTGSNAPIGQSIANAASLALLDINNPKLKLTIYNTAEGPSVAASRALADGAKVILGPLLAPDVRAVQPLAKAAGVPVIAFSNDASLAGGGTYILGFQPNQEIARVVEYARRRGISRFAALVPSGSYGQRVGKTFIDAVKSSGGTVTAIETFPRDKTKLLAPARRIANYDARVVQARARLAQAGGIISATANQLPPPPFQALLIADIGDYVRAFIPALRQYGVDSSRVRVLGPGIWSTEPSLAREPALQGGWFASVPDDTFADLSRRYASRYGSRPSRLASMGYDAILLVHAATTAGWTIGAPFPTATLRSTSGYTGVDGLFRLLPSGIAERGMEVQEFSNGQLKLVSPAPTSFTPKATNQEQGRIKPTGGTREVIAPGAQ